MISASMSDRSGRTLTGQTMEAFYRSVQHCSPLSFGLNCSLGAEEMIPLIAEVASFANCAVSCYPNAGLPNEMGEYDESPSQMAESVRKMALAGSVNIVGGCCGTTPEHIKAVAEAVKGISPRAIPEPDDVLYVSGLESDFRSPPGRLRTGRASSTSIWMTPCWTPGLRWRSFCVMSPMIRLWPRPLL